MKKTIKRLIPFLLILAMLCGCTSKAKPVRRTASTYDSQPMAAYSEPAEYGYAGGAYDMYADAVEEEMEVPTSAEAKKVNGDTSAFPTGRKIIRNAEVNIQTREYDAFMNGLNSRIAANGGYIESSYATGNSYSSRKNVRSTQLTVRIPAENLDAFLDGVCTMGNVLYKNVTSNDVTASYVDTEARLSALKTERETLMGLLEKASKMEDIIVIYERISEVTYEIESYESRIRSYDNQISYSTVSLGVTEVERETVVEKETTWEEISRRLKENLQDIGDDCTDLFIGLVSALPGILIFALIVFVIYLIIRAIVRKCRKKSAAKKSAAPEKAEKNEKIEKTEKK